MIKKEERGEEGYSLICDNCWHLTFVRAPVLEGSIDRLGYFPWTCLLCTVRWRVTMNGGVYTAKRC